MRDTLPSRPNTCESAIINLNTEEEPGSHWVAYKKEGKIVYYFDSFGNLPPPPEIVRYLKNCTIKYNYNTFQSLNSQRCGHLCLRFLNSI